MKNNRDDEEHVSKSYQSLRRLVGIVCFTLPIVLVVGTYVLSSYSDPAIRNSISDYYYTEMRDYFVGALFAIGFFLISYEGYEERDNIAGNLAGIFALGVALFPCGQNPCEKTCINWIHYISAVGLFATIAYFSIFLFTKTKSGGRFFEFPKISCCCTNSDCPSKEKLARNKIYLVCGVIIILCVIILLLNHCCFLKPKLVFVVETIIVLAFGLSWFVKGNTLFKDKDSAR